MPSTIKAHLDESGAIRSFQEDGAVLITDVFNKQWLDTIATGIDKNMASPSIHSESLSHTSGGGAYFNDYCNWRDISEFSDFVYNSPAAEIAGRLMESHNAIFYHEHVLVKGADTHSIAPWHHDQSYYPVDGVQNCSLWIPLDPVTVDRCVQFVKGSHRWGKWFYPRKFATNTNYALTRKSGQLDHRYEDVPEIDNHPEYEILKWDVQPGDCIAFHMMELHSSQPNTSDIKRRVVSTRWLGDDCVFADRPWKVSPPIDGGLQSGMPFKNHVFPLIWNDIIG